MGNDIESEAGIFYVNYGTPNEKILGEVKTGGVDMDKLWQEVKENSNKLKSCKYHEFEDMTTDIRYVKKFKCKNCNGISYQPQVYYYNLGIKHEKERKEAKK